MERQADAPVGSVSDAVLWIGRRQDQWSRGIAYAYAFAVADASGTALASGFAAEGVQRQKLAYDGVRSDVETHARLATDPVR